MYGHLSIFHHISFSFFLLDASFLSEHDFQRRRDDEVARHRRRQMSPCVVVRAIFFLMVMICETSFTNATNLQHMRSFTHTQHAIHILGMISYQKQGGNERIYKLPL